MGKAKSGKERQRAYLMRLKERNRASYLESERKRNREQLVELKKSDKNQYDAFKKKDVNRKKKVHMSDLTSTPVSSGECSMTRQTLGKAIKKSKMFLPQSPRKKVTVLTKLLSTLSPKSKSSVFCKSRKSLNTHLGRPKISSAQKNLLLSFLERPDVSYCKPGRKDTAYIGKNEHGEKVYKSKQYLLWPFNELVPMFNTDHADNKTTYHAVQQIVNDHKHLYKVQEMPEDDCRCEKCENPELFLLALKRHLRKYDYHDLADKFPTDPSEFVAMFVCSIKNYDCVDGSCDTCPNESLLNELKEAIKDVEEFNYAQWKFEDKRYRKVQMAETGEDAVDYLNEMVSPTLKIHFYNIYRQYSELKFLKANLKENEVILSVDFSRNYENKQRHEIQSAYFGHEAFTIYTAACYYKSSTISRVVDFDADSHLNVWSVALVSNEIKHERNIAFTCNNVMIKLMREKLPGLQTVYFWTDGCASQFRSQYTFKSLCEYPSDLKIVWDYGEAHHFKGPHDGIGGTVKRKVYQDVSSNKVIIQDAKSFAEHANKVCSVTVIYLDKTEINTFDPNGAIYIKGTLKIHHVERESESKVSFYFNSPYKQKSIKLRSADYSVNISQSEIIHNDSENFDNGDAGHNTSDTENNSLLTESEVKLTVDAYCVVRYEEELFPGQITKVHDNDNGARVSVMVKCKGGWSWPTRVDEIDYTKTNIVSIISSPPTPINNRGTFAIPEMNAIWGK